MNLKVKSRQKKKNTFTQLSKNSCPTFFWRQEWLFGASTWEAPQTDSLMMKQNLCGAAWHCLSLGRPTATFRWSCWGLFVRPFCPLCIGFLICKSAVKVFTSSQLPRMGNTSSVFFLSVLSPSPGKQRMMLAESWQRESKQKHSHYEAELQVLQSC